ncbi:hypothetical protein AJ80_00965 [Polytolypa hystricis UAMH7299]|uniref:HMG box domain-containing protein n=1 Tax=Polytolypa hystricis (strain UAMH7299) TaxID=1447883 RepID=A0A2B7Z0Y7_POLH7|nr:hypothetical protein AJ80_00965 [Polytolypa hystricis UAMH7299]
MSYDRVLPKPLALYYDPPRRELPSRTSTPVEHKIMTDRFSKIVSEEKQYDGRSASSTPITTTSTTTTGGIESKALASALSALSAPTPTTSTIASASEKLLPSAAISEISSPASTVIASPIPRKRKFCQLITSETIDQHERSVSSNSSKSNSSKDSTSVQFCLCQPDPKIPRPRNAFILFRQHFQAAVIAENPRLTNPAISKVIGERWRTLPAESKQDWKNLAEEEKARHQQQYPDYRYQPRRYGRNGTSNNTSSPGISISPTGASVCNRCGGRVMNPPSTPSTPFTPSLPSPPTSALSTQSSMPIARNLLHGRRARDDSGLPSPVQVGMNNTAKRPTGVRTHFRDNSAPPSSPNVKRRELNANGMYIPIRRDLSPESTYPLSPQRTALPRPDALQPRMPYSVGMAAASANGRPYRQAQTPGTPSHDPSLTLPPLQTMSLPQQNQSNVEAMVMTIPFINKIKVLARISPPAMLSPTRSEAAGRGAVIAIEGPDLESVGCMIQYLKIALGRDEKCVTRVFEGPEACLPQRDGKDPTHENKADATVQYLGTISAWHKISGDIMTFINGPSPTSALSRPNAHTIPGDPNSANSTKSIVEGGSVAVAAPPAAADDGLLRIALVPRYQLTTADTYACATPINDAYAPIDHWQWMASLWRGCVGPDITIYIRDCEKEEAEKFGDGHPVEIRLGDARTLVVRRPVDSAGAAVEEKALRRVAFEVDEFLRK